MSKGLRALGSWNPATDRCSELLFHNVSPILHDLTPSDEFCGRKKANAGTARSRSRHDWRTDREGSDAKRTRKQTADFPSDETKFLARVRAQAKLVWPENERRAG